MYLPATPFYSDPNTSIGPTPENGRSPENEGNCPQSDMGEDMAQTCQDLWLFCQKEKNSLKIKLLRRIFLRHQGPRRRDIPDKNFMQVAFFCCFRQGVAGMSRDLGRDVPDLEKLYAIKLWVDFSFPILNNFGFSSCLLCSLLCPVLPLSCPSLLLCAWPFAPYF